LPIGISTRTGAEHAHCSDAQNRRNPIACGGLSKHLALSDGEGLRLVQREIHERHGAAFDRFDLIGLVDAGAGRQHQITLAILNKDFRRSAVIRPSVLNGSGGGSGSGVSITGAATGFGTGREATTGRGAAGNNAAAAPGCALGRIESMLTARAARSDAATFGAIA
jgi:hypothetical protein